MKSWRQAGKQRVGAQVRLHFELLHLELRPPWRSFRGQKPGQAIRIPSGHIELARYVGVAPWTRQHPPQLHLTRPVDADVLERDYVGKVVSVWRYGVGDAVEIARVEE